MSPRRRHLVLLVIIYIGFISLGLPDSLLGAGWPTMYGELGVPVSYMGIVSMVISGGTIVSSLMSDRLTRKFGARVVTVVSVFLTAGALFGFSFSDRFWMLILFSVPNLMKLLQYFLIFRFRPADNGIIKLLTGFQQLSHRNSRMFG